MQSATTLLVRAPLASKTPINSVGGRTLPLMPKIVVYRRRTIIACIKPVSDTSTVDYSSQTSVFPAEACDTVGGEACDVQMFPETKPAQKQQATGSKTIVSEEVDREYLAYSEPKTVFPGEACDDLGGEFCEPEYQQGVGSDK
ncbi:putative Light-regulated protein [Zostera marina]|uniref:Putative Light-regulated protein n=1 Tax=Zostera marina TaxID=29655 RepID=A0A0K9P832_ZOSMR|nr:putative Light-regulated protein [Zostera marina]